MLFSLFEKSIIFKILVFLREGLNRVLNRVTNGVYNEASTRFRVRWESILKCRLENPVYHIKWKFFSILKLEW